MTSTSLPCSMTSTETWSLLSTGGGKYFSVRQWGRGASGFGPPPDARQAASEAPMSGATRLLHWNAGSAPSSPLQACIMEPGEFDIHLVWGGAVCCISSSGAASSAASSPQCRKRRAPWAIPSGHSRARPGMPVRLCSSSGASSKLSSGTEAFACFTAGGVEMW